MWLGVAFDLEDHLKPQVDSSFASTTDIAIHFNKTAVDDMAKTVHGDSFWNLHATRNEKYVKLRKQYCGYMYDKILEFAVLKVTGNPALSAVVEVWGAITGINGIALMVQRLSSKPIMREMAAIAKDELTNTSTTDGLSGSFATCLEARNSITQMLRQPLLMIIPARGHNSVQVISSSLFSS